MEASYWLRFGAIVAMLLGCLYVLAPTVLLQDEFEGGGAVTETEPAGETWLVAADGSISPEAVDALRVRLTAAGLADGVRLERERVVVVRALGADAEAVYRLAGRAGALAVYGPDAIGVDPAALEGAEDPAAAIASAVRAARLAGAPLPGAAIGGLLPSGDAVQASITGAEGAPFVVIAVDGEVVGHVVGPFSEGAPSTLALRPGGSLSARDLVAMALAGPMADTFEHEVLEAAPEQEAATPQRELTWWEPLLPDTRMALGLDLQGGIDMTLQVGLEEAVFSQVQRDQNELRDQIARDGVAITVRRDRARPALRFYTDLEYAKVQELTGRYLPDYDYVETASDDQGTYHVFQINEVRVTEIQDGAVEQVLETLRKRVDATGVKEPSIVKLGGGRINIQLPGVTGNQQAIAAIGTQAELRFYLVDEDADDAGVASLVTSVEKELPPDQFADDGLLNDFLHRTGKLREDRIILWQYEEVAPGQLERSRPIQLKDTVELTGQDVNDAQVRWDQSQQAQVILTFKSRGKTRFCEITTQNVNKRFAIVLDGQVRSAPNINEPICGGSAAITMGSSMDATTDANTLALVLRTGSLTAPLDIGEIREIGPSLGADAIRSGIQGSLFGGAITLLFMALWYRKPGMIADVALVLNVLLVFSLLAIAGATLTLPGIAGVALTIGMAVDANIIIYERIREELALGVTPRKAVDTGYEKGVVAVLDANVTTAIAGVVLYSYGTGPIRGFAVTLLIGIFTTLVTALFVTRTFMEMLTRNSSARLRI